jgi:hypothetical protein
VVVESGLAEGDEVIYRGHEYLQEGMAVAPTDWGVSGPRKLPEPAGETLSAPGKTLYTCPMHPEVQSDRPGICPKCKMNLEPQKPATGHSHGTEGR